MLMPRSYYIQFSQNYVAAIYSGSFVVQVVWKNFKCCQDIYSCSNAFIRH